MDPQEPQDLAPQEPRTAPKMPTWSETRRAIRDALELRARSAVLWVDATKDQSERERAKAQADQAEEALRDAMKALHDMADGASFNAKQVEVSFEEIARLKTEWAKGRTEVAKLKSAIVLQHAEREAQGRLLRALIARLSNDQVAEVFGDQVGYMADLLHERALRSPQGEEG